MENIKTFEVVVDYEGDEKMLRNSFVYQPAVEIEKFAFSKEEEKEMLMFNMDDNRQCFMSVSILADTPIPRIDRETGEKYNVVFTKETIRVIANKLALEGNQNEVSWQHTDQIIDGVYLVEQFISEKDRVYSPKFNVPDGSLIQTYWVKDKKLYDKLANDKSFEGFSIEIEAKIKEAFSKEENQEWVVEEIERLLFDNDINDDEKYEKIKILLNKN
ncbi:MAG: hypothetical protein GY870_06750 [archaeon]|nr:hypothetical protein [archaeon]